MHFTSDWKNLTILEQFIIISIAVRHLRGAHSFKQSLKLLDSSPHVLSSPLSICISLRQLH
ncbi:hypothetical protein BCR44DRAFT_1440863 [Catenaria anguillulae PL171]|uniref:Uncharacterized protein n=1 Tax=Catenaria anguillulae PL171 TaxID=765915 RepID=A0A1Y2HC27_9FUNG|nr:hypothetical protein BCR44DRAFT_1440863 [Catenaria anguillulae PL171]